MPWIDALIPAEIENKRRVMKETWGHLAPHRNAVYRGRIVYVCGIYGSDHLNPTVIFENLTSRTCGQIDGSPWWYDALHDFLRTQENEVGVVYEWTGQFINYQFTGERQVLIDSNQPRGATGK